MKSKVLALCIATTLLLTGCGASESFNEGLQAGMADATKEETPAEEVVEEVVEPTEFEVTLDVAGKWNGEAAAFDITTNLPDEAVLMLSLSRGDYNTDDNFTAETKVTVENGKAEAEGFSNKGEKLAGEFDLSVSMSLPRLQSDAVRAVIGQKGEYMTGNVVEKDSTDDSNVISALFLVSFGNEITVTPTESYTTTIFREEDEEAEISEEEIESIANDYAGIDAEQEKVQAKVQEYIDANYYGTSIDSITINPDLGTDADGDYVALVYLTWDQKNSGKTSQQMLDMYSSDMATRVYEDLPEIQKLAVFWTVPYLNNGSAKISFERVSGGMKYTDTVFDKNFN